MPDETKTLGDLIVQRAARHYKALGLREIAIPEWGEDENTPLVVYYYPITMAERQDFLRESAFDRDVANAGAIKAILTKSLDANGQPLFNLSHKHWLLTQAYGPVTERLADALMSTNLKPPAPRGKGETPEDQAVKS